MSDELDIMGTHTCKEISEGVWEHAFTPCSYVLSCALPQLSAVEAHKAINCILNSVNYGKSLKRVESETRARKRKRRKHRAAFRRRKHGGNR